jgi:hypothetical protein
MMIWAGQVARLKIQKNTWKDNIKMATVLEK